MLIRAHKARASLIKRMGQSTVPVRYFRISLKKGDPGPLREAIVREGGVIVCGEHGAHCEQKCKRAGKRACESQLVFLPQGFSLGLTNWPGVRAFCSVKLDPIRK